jgi:hypothetical protein
MTIFFVVLGTPGIQVQIFRLDSGLTDPVHLLDKTFIKSVLSQKLFHSGTHQNFNLRRNDKHKD